MNTTTDREILHWAASYLRSVRNTFTADAAFNALEPASAELLAAIERQLDSEPAQCWPRLPKLQPITTELATLTPTCPSCGKLDPAGRCGCVAEDLV